MLLCFWRYFSQGNPVLCWGSDSSVQSGATSIPHPNSPLLAATVNLDWTDLHETISVTTNASFSVFQCLVTCVELVHKYWQQNTVMRSKGAACNLWWAKLGESLELGHCHNEIQGRSPQKLTHLLQSRKVFSSGMRLWSSHYIAVHTEHQWSVSRTGHWSSQIYIFACILRDTDRQ